MSSKQIRVEVPSNSHITIEGDVDEGEEIIVKGVESEDNGSEKLTYWSLVWEKIGATTAFVWGHPEHVATLLNWMVITLTLV